jgi:hypothetical protein
VAGADHRRGLAAQALNSLAAGGIAAGSALAPLTGLARRPPRRATSRRAGGGHVEARDGRPHRRARRQQGRSKKLTPEARSFLGVLKELKGDKRGLSRTAQQGLFPGLKAGVEDARKNLPVLNTIVGETATTMGHLAEQAGALVGSKGFGKDLALVGERNTRHPRARRPRRPGSHQRPPRSRRGGGPVDELALAVRRPARAPGGAADARGAQERRADALLHGDAGRGGASRVDRRSLASGLWEVGKAAAPLGRDILASLDKTAQHWETWTKSVEGQNALKAYFEQAKPALFEAGRLLHDVVLDVLKFGNTPETTEMIRQLRTELLPVLCRSSSRPRRRSGPISSTRSSRSEGPG